MRYFYLILRKNYHLIVILCLLFSSTSTIAQITQTEFEALKALYDATNGNQWTNRVGWENIHTTATANDVNDSWKGIKIEGGHVTKILLRSNNLVGNIPAQIGDFAKLTTLDLSSNTLSGAIPSQISKLTELRFLLLTNNEFSGNFLSGISLLTQLSALSLGGNQLTGAVPESLGNLVNLERLSLVNNNFTSLPTSIKKLVKLKDLNLRGNKLLAIPAEIGDLTLLETLDLRDNQLVSLPVEIGKLHNLKDFHAQDNQLSSLPDFSGEALFTPRAFDVENNHLSFGDLLPNKLKLRRYSPQNKLEVTSNTVMINDGERLALSINVVGGNNNKYQWFKDGTFSSDAVSEKSDSPVFTKNNVTLDDAGSYVCKVTNSTLSNLTLEHKEIIVTVNDDNPPLTQTLFPSNGNTLSIDLTTISVSFSEKLKKGTGTLMIKDKVTDATVHSITIQQSHIFGKSLLLPINAPAEGSYYITMSKGIVTDEAGNEFAGIDDKTSWTFVIDKNIKPTVSSLSPANNSTNANAATLDKIKITFSERIKKGLNGFIRIKKNSNGATVESIMVSSSAVTIQENTVTIQLGQLLVNEQSYYVTIPANAFEDMVGNAFDGFNTNSAWTFSLGTSANPVLNTKTPAHGSGNIPVNLGFVKMSFSEKVKKGRNGVVRIKKVNNDEEVMAISIGSSHIQLQDNDVKVVLNQLLAPNTVYYVQITAGTIQDLAGNSFAGIEDKTSWRFTTGETSMPLVTTLSPTHNSTIQFNFNALRITFSEVVQKGSGVIEIRQKQDKQLLESIFVSSSDVTIDGKEAVIKFDATILNPETTYYVTVPARAFKDTDGNEFSGIDENEWVFNTSLVNSIATLSSKQLSVSPNPSSSKFQTTLYNYSGAFTYQLLSSTGNTVKSGFVKPGVGQFDIDLSEYPAGIYVLYVTTKQGVLVKRLVKN